LCVAWHLKVKALDVIVLHLKVESLYARNVGGRAVWGM
jgi:hypothetical protein